MQRYEAFTMIGKLNTKHVDTGADDLIELIIKLSPPAQQLLLQFKHKLQWGKCKSVLDNKADVIEAIIASPEFKELFDVGIAAWSKENVFMLCPDYFLPWANDYDMVNRAWVKAHRTPQEVAVAIAKHKHDEAVRKAAEITQELLDAHTAALKIQSLLDSQRIVIGSIIGHIPVCQTKGHLTAAVSLSTGITQSQTSVLLANLEGVCWKSYKHRDGNKTATRYTIV